MKCSLIAILLLLWLSAPSFAQVKPAEIAADDLAAVKAAEAARVAVIANVYGSVVAIFGNDRKGGGSGVLYDAAGYALTNHHVVAAAGDEGWAGLADGKLYRWKLLGTDPGGDVAIIRLQGRTDFPTSPLADSETVKVGDWSMAMGNPFVLAEDLRPTVTLGIVSGTHRFQPGDGLNTLVYGNCIQVDSSINPGNSGGPLFNLRGEVIGINGRGSFEERGRVNVGLGYAISSNQVKNFIPDLLATKVAQHGTLDAQFGNRLGGVICQTINLNSPAARAGLELGDRLVAFEGVEISNANQFTNIISTYPADWPCEVTFEHPPGGQRKTIHVRLTALPYDLGQPMPPMPMPLPDGEEKPPEGEEKKADDKQEKPADTKPEDAKPEDQDNPEKKPAEGGPDGEEKFRGKRPMPIQIGPQRAPLDPGKVRFPELMKESVMLLLKKWQAGANAPEALEASEDIVRGEDVVGTAKIIIAADGRFKVSVDHMGDSITVAFDGKSFWRQNGKEKAEEVPFEKAIREPLAAHAVAVTLMLRGESHDAFGVLSLDGGDKAQSQVAYRISTTPAEQDPLYTWLSVFDDKGQLGVQLLKTGIGLHDDEPIPALTCHDWKSVAGIHWPHRKVYVKGLAEAAGDEVRTKTVEPIALSDELFRIPQQ